MDLSDRFAAERRLAELGQLIAEIDEALGTMKGLKAEAVLRRAELLAERIQVVLSLKGG